MTSYQTELSKPVRLVTTALCLAIFSLVLVGCNGRPAKPELVQISGKLLLPSGSPVTGGVLILRPENGVFGATAKIQPDGSFTLEDTGNQGVVPGKYQVFVRFSDADPVPIQRVVNERYQQSSEDGDSDVIVDIQSNNDNLEIRLNR